MRRSRAPSHFPVSLYATPSPLHEDIFYVVPRAGHLVGGPDHHIKRDHFPGHELILCLRGRGFVKVSGRTHQVAAGQLVWVDCGHPHEHGAIAEDPWEVYWVRAHGPRLVRIAEALDVATSPVFVGYDSKEAAPLYRQVFRLMQERDGAGPALIHAAVARLVALAFACRQRHLPAPPQAPTLLQPALERMKLFSCERQRVGQLAAACGLSASHFSRLFRCAFGTSPIDWLRRERISQAKRLLTESDDAIKRIAEQVGYGDRYFFSKDFKRFTGLTPREFRRREMRGPGA